MLPLKRREYTSEPTYCQSAWLIAELWDSIRTLPWLMKLEHLSRAWPAGLASSPLSSHLCWQQNLATCRLNKRNERQYVGGSPDRQQSTGPTETHCRPWPSCIWLSGGPVDLWRDHILCGKYYGGSFAHVPYTKCRSVVKRYRFLPNTCKVDSYKACVWVCVRSDWTKLRQEAW